MRLQTQITGQEPLALSTVKAFVRALPGSTEDELLGIMISAARDYCERLTGRSYIDKTMTAYPDTLKELRLPGAPILSIDRIVWKDAEGSLHTIGNEAITVNADTGEVDVTEETPGAVGFTVDYRTGCGDAVPPVIQQGMLFLVGAYYQNREAFQIGNAASVEAPMGIREFIRTEKVWWF